MLEIVDVQAHYGRARILSGISATVEKGRILGIVGPNGAGKTTLLKCIARIIRRTGGSVRIDGAVIDGMPRSAIARRLGYVPQHVPARFSMTVFETVLTGRRPHAAWRPSDRDLHKTARILQKLNLDDLAMRDVSELSGGQLQKVLLARALAQEPDYLLLDEPTSSLDLYHQLEVMEMVADLARENIVGVAMAVHDLSLAARFSHDLLMMKGGEVVGKGSPAELLTPAAIRDVYGVDADVRRVDGRLCIHPLRCARGVLSEQPPHPELTALPKGSP